MKKILILFIVLLLAGCSDESVESSGNIEEYYTYYQQILDNGAFITESNYYDIELAINQVDQGYRYSVIIDNPQVAMYNIEALTIIDDNSASINNSVVFPSVGVFDGPYNMLPGQQNISAGFVKGIIMDGIIDSSEVEVLVMVSWENSDRSKYFKEFITVKGKFE